MTIDDARVRARQRLEELIGVDEAACVIADRPAGGWDSLVTKEHLALELAALRGEFRGELGTGLAGLRTELHKELRAQTWRLGAALLATVTAVTAILRVT